MNNKLFNPISRKITVSIFLVAAAILTSFVVKSANTAAALTAIDLASDPLYAASAGDKPVLSLALSVEYPTVGAQYVAGPNATTDAGYSNKNEYLGYYDAEGCYTYIDAPKESVAAGLTTADYKRFDRTGAAKDRMCENAFSGNFLNWASNSAIDMLRLALSGGDRYIDTPELTILQRAVLPNGDPVCMWNSTNFPAKQLQKDGGTSGSYWGAVPKIMITQAKGSDIWIANTLNRIYFGTSRTGSCGSTTGYTLAAAVANGVGPVQSGSVLPSDATKCASENGTCSFAGIKEIWYGAGNKWSYAPASNEAACTNAVFGDPITGTAKNCYSRPYTGSWSPSSAANSLNSDGFFYARVNVCAKDSSNTLTDVRDYGLCKIQPNGNYKPVGSIQKYSDQLRLSAFGYVIDQTKSGNGGRYGGVLRAPMKYVGAKTYDIGGVENTPTTGNPKLEWNIDTGVFYPNPDNDTTQNPPISGVINYLNKFGRTGPTPGRYKIYDPVGELYYENLRYLQGLPPTDAAVSGIDASMEDGFPVSRKWTDPYGDGRTETADYSCLKSNIVVIGDINTHDGNRMPTPDEPGNVPNIGYWSGIVQAFEANRSVTYLDGQDDPRTTGNPNTPNGNAPGNPIVGAAYWGHTHDIRGKMWKAAPTLQRPGLRVKSYLFDVNEYGASNDPNIRQNRNQFFTAAKYGGFETDSSNKVGKPYNSFGNPFKQQDGTNNNNVWQDPDASGEASTYYLQSSARGVLKAFESIFSRSTTAARSIAGSSLQNSDLSASSGTLIYQSTFDTADWSGNVVAYPITLDKDNLPVLGEDPKWSAASKLDNRTKARNIVVGRTKTSLTASDAKNPDQVARDFVWNDKLDADLKTNLGKLTSTSSGDGLAQQRLEYLRGSKDNEAKPFRTRKTLLGDIINSGVVYSGAPAAGSTYSKTYAEFLKSYQNRTTAVFVGSNDGMLHAFDATNGDEVFAYIPSWMGAKLSALTSTSYTANHQSYVDSTPRIKEAQVAFAGQASDWKTVLVSGTGAGGKGVFALDVSDPNAFDASKVMWEFTQEDDIDMGYVIGKPDIAMLRTNADSTTATPTYRSFALVASGVNNYVGSNLANQFSTGNPALFLLALDKKPGAAWVEGGNYYKISLPFNQEVVDNKIKLAPGLVNFSLTYGNAGEVQYVYMGDLHGQIWKLDFSAYGVKDWNLGKLSSFNKGDSKSPKPYPLYITKTAAPSEKTGVIQPISMAPAIVTGPTLGGTPTRYIAVATGKYFETSDKTSQLKNSFYVIYDNGSTAADGSPIASAISGRPRLMEGKAAAGVVSVPSFQWGRAGTDLDAKQRSGWYFDFPTSGEREIGNILIEGDNLIFGTLTPAATGATGSCAADGGSGSTYILNADNGAGTYVSPALGVGGEPSILNNSILTKPSATDTTGRRIRTEKKIVLNVGSSGISKKELIIQTVTGRLSWRQINNYQDLKNQ